MSALEQMVGRRVLFMNWRDQSNPAAGGAESFTEQVARRFVRAGASLTLFTSTYPGAQPFDWTDGYLIIRKGGRFGVYSAAGRHLKRYADHYDAVVDFQNGIPFFAPLWAPATPVVCVVHHVHQSQFDVYFRWPLNHVGRLLEGRVSRHVYPNGPWIAVSPSTRAEMRRALGLRGPVHIVPSGLDVPPSSSMERSSRPRIAVVTRLVPHKQLDHLVAIVPDLLLRWPDLRVDIAGTGTARDGLLAQVNRLGLENSVFLPGRVSEQTKSDLLSQAWITVAPSLAEGWGLTVIEANAMGTPTVAYDVSGLRDSIHHAVTGWLVQPGHSLATTLISAMEELSDPLRQQLVAKQAKDWAAKFSWDSSAERLAAVLLAEIRHREIGSPGRRRNVDLATMALWPSDTSGELASLLRTSLRVTDVISSDGSRLQALLMGCDEMGAAKALQRVPVPPTMLRLATTSRVMSGSARND